jgi:hypothetical protein
MAQPSRRHSDFSAGFHRHLVLCPTRSGTKPSVQTPQRSHGRMAAIPLARVRARAIGGPVVLEVCGRLGDVGQDLDEAIQLALADGPRGVICDLSTVAEGADTAAVARLATAGRHVRDWPGIPVAVACPDSRLRNALAAHPMGEHLLVTGSRASALSAILASPISDVECLRLTPHPTSPHASRNFVTRTLLDWGLGGVIPTASLVVNELVTNSTIHAGTHLEVSLAWNLGALRLTVRDHSPDLPRQRYSRFDERGRGLSVVTALSRAFGVLPTADGGKVVWAVLNAARPHPTRRPRSSALDHSTRIPHRR